MAFNINAHVILSGPKNIKAVTKNIQKQLGTVKARVQLDIPKNLGKNIGGFNKGIKNLTANLNTLKGAASSANSQLAALSTKFNALNKSSGAMAKSQAKVQDSLRDTGKHAKQAGNEIQAFGKDAALALRRFAGFTLATTVVFGFVRAVTTATKAALDFQREITKVVQVTGASVGQIDKLKSTINELSVSLGVDANELAELSRIFSQTGQSIDQVRASIRAVARSSLAPSFGEMKNTAEGLIAAMAQFNIAANRSEEVLAGLNAVSKKFAVEAEDLVSVIRRAGGVFSVASGQFRDPVDSLNELIGIFTAVRSTTRESADTIAVGLRTIFTRIQRSSTIDFLKQFNIELVNAKGQFIGVFPAFQQLAKGLDGIIKSGDALKLSAITEELGGVRQVGKLIPAITQFNKALAATKVAGDAGVKGLGKDVAIGLQPLGKQLELIQQRFSALIRTITESKTFQGLAKVALSLGNAFLSVAESLTPLLPLITTFATIKISKGMFDFAGGFLGGLKKGGGAGGVGGTLGGAMSGATTAQSTTATAASTSAQQALTGAVNKNTGAIGLNNTALGRNTTGIGQLTPAITNASTNITTASTNVIGAIGNLINALKLAPLGGGPKKFARGGPVKGPSHAQGGVPAVLEGGEYVIPKKYAKGGLAVRQLESNQFAGLFAKPIGKSDTSGRPLSIPLSKGEEGKEILAAIGAPKGYFIGGTDEASFEKSATQKLRSAINQILRELGAKDKAGGIGQVPVGSTGKRLLDAIGVTDIAGKVFEGVARAVAKSIPEKGNVDSQATFDVPRGSAQAGVGAGSIFANMFNAGQALPNIDYDAKLSASHGNRQSLLKKAYKKNLFDPSNDVMLAKFQNAIKTEDLIRSFKSLKGKKGVKIHRDRLARRKQELLTAIPATEGISALDSDTKQLITNRIKTLTQKISAVGLAAGGNVFAKQGTDTVPAMLTPGEFVVNKKSAQKIGYGNLGKMNRYAQGGRVQYLRGGGTAGLPPISGGGGANPAATANMAAATSSMSLFYGLQSATAALVGFTTALAGFDTKKPVASLMAVGMAAVQGAIAFKLLFPQVKLGAMLQGAQNVAVANGAKETASFIKEIRRFGSGAWRGGVIARGRAAAGAPIGNLKNAPVDASGSVTRSTLAKELRETRTVMKNVATETTHWNSQMTTARAKIDAARKSLVKQEKLYDRLLKSQRGLKPSSVLAGQRGQQGLQVRFARNNLQNVMKTQAPTVLESQKMLGILKGRKADLTKRATDIRGAGKFSPEVLKAWNKTQAKMSRGMSSMFNTLKTKMPKTFAAIGKVGIKGWGAIIGLLIVGPIVGAIGKGIDKAIFGKKEKIEGTNIEGRGGMTAGAGAAMGGMLEGAGTAVGAGLTAGLTAAMIPGLQPFAPAIGVAVAALSLVKSAFLGVAKQAEFLAFKELGKAIDNASEQMDKFANLNKFNIDALAEVNKSLAKVDKRFQESFKASFFRERSEQAFTFGGMFGKEGILSDLVGGGGLGRGAGMAGGAAAGAFSGAGIGAGIGLAISAITGGAALPLVPVLAAIGAGIGLFVGLGAAIFTVDKRAEAAGKAFDKAAKQITPEFLEKIDTTFEKTVQGMMLNLESLDSSVLANFSNIELGSVALNPAEEQSNLNASMGIFVNTMKDAETALGGAAGAGGRFVKEFNKLMQMKVKFNLVDAIRNQAEFMEKEAGDSFKQAMMPILASIDFGNTPESLVAGLEATEKALREVGGVNESAANAALDSVVAQKELMLAEIDAAATAALVAINLRAAARAFDALAAGLDVFANSVKGVEDQLSQFTSAMKKEFENLFSDSIKIGQVNTINPFSNIDSSSRSQIRAGMSQVGSLSKQGLADPAFRGIESLVSESKEIPFALADTLRELEGRSGSEALDASDVMKELRSQLEKRGIKDLPDSALKGVRDLVEGAEVGRQGGEAGGFSMDELKKLLSEEGDVAGQLSGIAGEALSAMEAAFDAATGYRNALLELASLQQELLQKETSMRLSLIDKQQNAIDRMNKALGRTPDAMQTATGHLSKRLTELTKERVGERGLSTGIGGVANVFDVNQLISQREQLQSRRKELRGQLGVAPGEIFRTDSVDVQSEAQKKQAKELGLVNAQLNGNTSALKELANDTRMLAAIEQQILELQKKALSAEQSAMTLAKAQIAVASGEMTPEDFKKNFTDPLNALHTYSRGGEISPQMLVKLQEKFSQGDPAFTGIFDKMVEDIALDKKAKGDTRSLAEIETAVRRQINDQMNEQIVGAGAATGIGGPGLNQFSREQLLRSRTLRDKADAKGEEGISLAEKQAQAMEALFENQKKGFQEIFKAAEEGIDKAVDKFDKAVDKFRDLRGEGLTPLEAEEKKLAADKKVKDLETALAAEEDPEKKKRIEEKLLDAKDEQRDATNAANRSTQAQQDEIDRVKNNNIANQKLADKAKEEKEQLIRDKAGQEEASRLWDNIDSVDGGEHFLSNLAEQQGISNASLGLSSMPFSGAVYSDIDDMLGVGRDSWLGPLGLGNNQEMNEENMTTKDARLARRAAFKSMSDQMFGPDSKQSIAFNKILQDSFAQTQDAGGNANMFNKLVQEKLKDYLEAQADPDNAITGDAVIKAGDKATKAQEIADKSDQTLTDLLATQSQEQQDIADLRNRAASGGSIFTHDIHLEKLLHAILATLQGKEAVSPELSKASQGKGKGMLSTLMDLFTRGSIARKALGDDGGDVKGLLTNNSVAGALTGAAGSTGIRDILTQGSVARTALGGDGDQAMDLITQGSIARMMFDWFTGGGDKKVKDADGEVIDSKEVIKAATPTEGAITKKINSEIAATGNINDDCCDAIVNGLAALGNIFKEGLVKVAPEVAKETVKATAKAATSDPAASEPAEVVVEMGENERDVRERHRQEDARRAENEAETGKIMEGVDTSAFDGTMGPEWDEERRKKAEQIKKDNKAKRDKEIAEAKAQDAGRSSAEQAGLLRSPAEQAALDAASRAKHAADIDASFADTATRVKKVDPKDLENKRKAETAPNIGASEFNARPGDHITRMKAFREAARHSADPSLRDYAGSLAEPSTATPREERRRRGGLTPRQRVQENVDQVKKELAALEAKQKVAKDTGSGRDFSKAIERKNKQIANMERSLSPGGMPMTARDEAIKAQQAEDQARAKAEADKKAAAAAAAATQQEAQAQRVTDRAQAIQGPASGGTRGTVPITQTKVQDPATDVGAALAEAAQSIRTSLVEGGPEIGSSIAISMKDNMEPVGAAIADSMKKHLKGNIIDINAKIGPIQVQLTDGQGALKKMDMGIVSKFEALMGNMLNKLFNTDITIKDNISKSSLSDAKNTIVS